MTTDSGRLFMQTAIQLEELRDADAARVLEMLPEGQDAGRFAEKLGVLSASGRMRVQDQLGAARKKTAKKKSAAKMKTKTPSRGATAVGKSKKKKTPSKGAVPVRRTTRRTPKKSSPLPLVGVALAVGLGVGAAIVVAARNDEPAPRETTQAPAKTTEVAEALPAPTVDASETAQAKELAAAKAKRAQKKKTDAKLLASAEAMVEKLKRRGRERSALQVLEELISDRGPFLGARRAKTALLRHCESVVTQQGRRADRLVGAGDLEGALKLLAQLATRMPQAVQPRIETLTATLKARAAAMPKPEPKPAAEAKAPEARETPAPVVAKKPVAEEEEDAEDDEDDTFPSASRPAPKKKKKGPVFDTTSEFALKVKEKVNVRHTLTSDGTLNVIYPLRDGADTADFKARGWDTFDVHAMTGVRDYQSSIMGLECGAGSRRMARMAHSIHFDGDFSIEVEVWVAAASGRSMMVFMLGKKHGVSFGQQLVRVSKSGKLKRLSRRPADPSVFREERRVKMRFDYVDGTLTVRCNGRKTAIKRFTKGELKGPFGLVARDVRLQITHLSIKAKVDRTKL